MIYVLLVVLPLIFAFLAGYIYLRVAMATDKSSEIEYTINYLLFPYVLLPIWIQFPEKLIFQFILGVILLLIIRGLIVKTKQVIYNALMSSVFLWLMLLLVFKSTLILLSLIVHLGGGYVIIHHTLPKTQKQERLK